MTADPPRRRYRTTGLPRHLVGRVRPAALGRCLPRRVAVRGSSMAPALRDGDVVLALPGARVRAGGVSLVRWPARPAQLSVKRLARTDDGGRSWHALGDNAAASTDSRVLGAAEALGPVVCRLWPRPGRVRPGRYG